MQDVIIVGAGIGRATAAYFLRQAGLRVLVIERERLHTRRSLLVGDAAGLMDPLLGESVRYAMRSGWLAAQAVLREDLSPYSHTVHRLIGNHLILGRAWAWAFYRHPWGSFCMGVRNRYLNADFVRMFTGELSYGAMLLRMPRYALGWMNAHVTRKV